MFEREIRCVPWILVGIALFFVGEAADVSWLKLLAKPLPVLGLAYWLMGWQRPESRIVVGGLIFGALGDEILELGYFVPGLLAFLVGHIIYIVAFYKESPTLHLARALPAVVYISVLMAICLPHTGNLSIPIVVYGCVIGTMVWRALARIGTGLYPWIGVVGATTFAFSDSLIALNKFVTPLPGIHPVIMVTYWLGQGLVAASMMSGPKALAH